MRVQIKFEPRDLWVGVYWERRFGFLNIYVCLLPMLPIKLSFRRKKINMWALEAERDALNSILEDVRSNNP